ncbi:DUF308 domain-containing protein [Brucepastera parasyntrophica]|uniref:HdeD family acid-resistance protein n=1 Tax=Brucepastera parasyntrophica TaxID=2880008 RepID=UPI0021087757|nr:DUF308 domain-containing protein [Brucepastera parasyntrophica]ULQ59633.1 DUF308 domain-containing protein [Brucepastera parasyntrophica]
MGDSESKRKFGWGSFIVGILYIIVALIAFRNPLADMLAITMIFGIMAIVSGIVLIINRNGTIYRIVLGVINIIFGIIFLFNLGLTASVLPYVFAVWFIAYAIANLFNLKYVRMMGKGYFWLSLIINILCIIVGIMLLFNPISSALTIAFLAGFYFLATGIEAIVYAFTG